MELLTVAPALPAGKATIFRRTRVLELSVPGRISLPFYSPDLNPIEQVFAKLKTLLRKAEAGSVEKTWKSISAALDAVTPDEGTNHLINAGYAPM